MSVILRDVKVLYKLQYRFRVCFTLYYVQFSLGRDGEGENKCLAMHSIGRQRFGN